MSKTTSSAEATGDTLDLNEAAAYLKLGYQSTLALYESGEIPGVSLTQKHFVFLRSDLEDYLRRKAREQQANRRAGDVSRPEAPKRQKGAAKPELSQYEGAAP